MTPSGKRRQDTRTRRSILDTLKRTGPQSAQQLAASLGISAMAVRQHLYALASQKLATFTEAPRPRGRPEKRWQLTPDAASFFPDGHAELTVELVGTIRHAFGNQGLKQLLEVRARQQIDTYQSQMARYQSLRRRVTRLAEIRSSEGYMAEVVAEPGGTFLLVENHCPICTAATACTGLCGAELEVFQTVLGNAVNVERCEHILEGDRRCVYRVSPKAST